MVASWVGSSRGRQDECRGRPVMWTNGMSFQFALRSFLSKVVGDVDKKRETDLGAQPKTDANALQIVCHTHSNFSSTRTHRAFSLSSALPASDFLHALRLSSVGLQLPRVSCTHTSNALAQLKFTHNT